MDWKKYSDILGSSGNSRTYCLPLLAMNDDEIIEDEEETVESFKICHNSLLAILGKGRAFWSTCCKVAEANQVPAHGLKGRPSNRSLDQDSETFLSLHCFFGDMEELTEPRATRMIHEVTNNGLRDDNDTLDLPACTTKRELFRRWAFDRGFILTINDAGNWKKQTRADFEGGKELVICSTSCSSCCGFGMLTHFMTDRSRT